MRACWSLLTALTLPAVAGVLADPTRPPSNWQADPARAGSAKQDAPRLTSILIGVSRRVAVIDGSALSEGQTSNGVTVVHIGKGWVEARVHGTTVRLSLADAGVTKEPR